MYMMEDGTFHSSVLWMLFLGEHFMKLFVSDFHGQILKATEILASDWLRANLSVEVTDKMLHERTFYLQSF